MENVDVALMVAKHLRGGNRLIGCKLRTSRIIHNLLRESGFVKCRSPHRDERGYTLIHHKDVDTIQIYFDSFQILDEASQVLEAEGIKGVKSLPDKSQGCFLSIKSTERINETN